MALCCLIYKSRYAQPLTEDLIRGIEEVSKKNNQELDITGILIGNKTSFMQVLEGEQENVNRIYNAICKDDRHSRIDIISYELIPQRQFSDWSMKCVSIGLMGRILSQRLKEKYGEEDSDLALPSDAHKAFALLYDVAYLLKNDEII